MKNIDKAALEEIFDQSPVGFWEWDIISGDQYLSPFFKKILGYKSHDTQKIFKSFQEIVLKDDLPFVEEKFDRHVESKGNVPFYNEIRFHHKKGLQIWVVFAGKVTEWGDDGKPVRMSGYAIDITRQKRVEEKFSEERKRFEFILQATNTSINIMDSEYNLGFVDAEWQKTYGDPRGRKCYEYFMGLDRPCTGCGVPKALETKKVFVSEEFMPKENRVVEVHTIPFQNKKKEWLVAEFNIDITARKRAEEALNNFQKLEALGVLAGGIAHDFNNLMGGIFGYIDMAFSESRDPSVSGYLEKAMSTIDRARGLTGQLLTFAKGGAPLRKTGHLFPFIQETAKFALSGSSIACRFDVQEGLWMSNFDKNQIGQVFDNLIINAKQSMPVGGKIDLVARNIIFKKNDHPILPKGKYIKIAVKDMGIGIPKELLPKIFDPFFTTKSKGHGLGLATCYSIINRHGGCIDADSEPGKGTVFNVYLPASEDIA